MLHVEHSTIKSPKSVKMYVLIATDMSYVLNIYTWTAYCHFLIKFFLILNMNNSFYPNFIIHNAWLGSGYKHITSYLTKHLCEAEKWRIATSVYSQTMMNVLPVHWLQWMPRYTRLLFSQTVWINAGQGAQVAVQHWSVLQVSSQSSHVATLVAMAMTAICQRVKLFKHSVAICKPEALTGWQWRPCCSRSTAGRQRNATTMEAGGEYGGNQGWIGQAQV